MHRLKYFKCLFEFSDYYSQLRETQNSVAQIRILGQEKLILMQKWWILESMSM